MKTGRAVGVTSGGALVLYSNLGATNLGSANMAKQAESESYSEQETEARMQAALRGARIVGPTTRANVAPKKLKRSNKLRAKKRQS